MLKKLVAIGDVHGRDAWKQIVYDNPDAGTFVFVGDYFDSKDESLTAAIQIYNFLEIVTWKKTREELGDTVILLVGNHDYEYMPEIFGSTGIGGFQSGAAPAISQVLQENRDQLTIAWSYDNLLFTHAGVSEEWCRQVGVESIAVSSADKLANAITDLWQFKPLSFMMRGSEPSGDSLAETPIWIRPKSLMKSSQGLKKAGIIQIVGHTQVKEIDIKGMATGGKYFFIDAIAHQQYLIYEDGKFRLGRFEYDIVKPPLNKDARKRAGK